MFGRDWQATEATIVDRQRKQTSGSVLGAWEFVADVRSADGSATRATIQEPTIATDFWAPGIGDVVGVLVDSGRDKVKFDKDDPRISAKARKQQGQDRLAASAAQAPGTSAATAAMPAPFPAGAQIVSASPELLSGLLSGDPTQMQAAAEALRASAGAVAGGPTPASGPDATDPAVRLAKLDALKASGLLTDAEHAEQRRRILDAI